ncbi:unnamed protein product [Effrenium voratum]|uniref:Uncharacterized protein n=1 Tax=Effrenium voratum TaxID=2562239 RepID=A0AA36JHH3_9DINO|nr:unnamed protein product [Effrenium voratum]
MAVSMSLTRVQLKQLAPEVYDFWCQQQGKSEDQLNEVHDVHWVHIARKASDFVDWPIWAVYLFIPRPFGVCLLHNHRNGGGCFRLQESSCDQLHVCLYCACVGTRRPTPQQPGHAMFLQNNRCPRILQYESEMEQLMRRFGKTEAEMVQAIQHCVGAASWWRVFRPRLRAAADRQHVLPDSLSVTNRVKLSELRVKYKVSQKQRKRTRALATKRLQDGTSEETVATPEQAEPETERENGSNRKASFLEVLTGAQRLQKKF